jgi:hypothetical protein
MKLKTYIVGTSDEEIGHVMWKLGILCFCLKSFSSMRISASIFNMCQGIFALRLSVALLDWLCCPWSSTHPANATKVRFILTYLHDLGFRAILQLSCTVSHEVSLHLFVR